MARVCLVGRSLSQRWRVLSSCQCAQCILTTTRPTAHWAQRSTDPCSQSCGPSGNCKVHRQWPCLQQRQQRRRYSSWTCRSFDCCVSSSSARCHLHCCRRLRHCLCRLRWEYLCPHYVPKSSKKRAALSRVLHRPLTRERCSSRNRSKF